MSKVNATSSTPAPKQPTEAEKQQIGAEFQAQKQALQQLASQLSELELDREEHKLVIDTIAHLPASRKCFRMIGGVLVERTVQEVLPALRTNQKGISEVLEVLRAEYATKEKKLAEFQEKHRIKVVMRT